MAAECCSALLVRAGMFLDWQHALGATLANLPGPLPGEAHPCLAAAQRLLLAMHIVGPAALYFLHQLAHHPSPTITTYTQAPPACRDLGRATAS
jgi:hypothetical protein